MKQVKPLGNRILVEVQTMMYDGLIELPDTRKMEKLLRGKVVDRGSKVNSDIQVGDIVVFEGCYGKEVSREDERRVLDVGCLLAVEKC